MSVKIAFVGLFLGALKRKYLINFLMSSIKQKRLPIDLLKNDSLKKTCRLILRGLDSIST